MRWDKISRKSHSNKTLLLLTILYLSHLPLNNTKKNRYIVIFFYTFIFSNANHSLHQLHTQLSLGEREKEWRNEIKLKIEAAVSHLLMLFYVFISRERGSIKRHLVKKGNDHRKKKKRVIFMRYFRNLLKFRNRKKK